jgi:hypothetical protein
MDRHARTSDEMIAPTTAGHLNCIPQASGHMPTVPTEAEIPNPAGWNVCARGSERIGPTQPPGTARRRVAHPNGMLARLDANNSDNTCRHSRKSGKSDRYK